MIEQLSKLRKSLLFIAAFLLTSLHMTATNRDSLALTPPMGFMTWNKYKEDDVLVIDRNLKGIEYTMSQCCHPIFGYYFFGFLTN